METQLFQVISQICPLTGACSEEISRLIRKQEFPRGYLIQNSQSVCNELYFVEKGLIRFFYHDREGNEVTYHFFEEGHITSILDSYYTQTPSRYNVECLEDSVIHTIKFPDFEELLDQFPELDKVYNSILRKFLLHAEHRIMSFQFYSAEERYQDLLTNQPTIVQRVALRHIASYLGINQATLSRVRSKVRF